MKSMIRVIIADDHSIVRRGLKNILDETLDISVIAEAENAFELCEKLKKDIFDVVILDISMPDKNGLEVLDEIKVTYPKLPILIMTVHSEEQYSMRALKSGASGYLRKDSKPQIIIDAIRKVSKGGIFISEKLAETLALNVFAPEEKMPHENLSNREYHIMIQLASGKTVNEISEDLNISYKTVSTYRSKIMEKMNLKNNVDIAHYAIKNKLID